MRIAFISAMASHPWGGSEELWAGAAKKLALSGHSVGACVAGWKPQPTALQNLRESGVEIYERRDVAGARALARHARNRWNVTAPGLFAYERWLRKFNPDVVCVSCGNFKDGLWCLEHLREQGYSYASIVQANAEFLWPKDEEAERLRCVYQSAEAVYFVSEANKRLLENQLATRLIQAEIVRNPYNVDRNLIIPWPETGYQFKLAFVGRLEPDAKGQDLLIEVMASQIWKDRPLSVSLFGDGNAANCLERLVKMYGLQDRVKIKAPVSDISQIWKSHHGLILPSRYEGLPLVLVEASLMARMSIVTDVAGNCEVITDGFNGFVAKAPSVASLAEAMEQAWNRRGEWKSMGHSARKRALELVPADPCEEFANKLVEKFGIVSA